MKETAAPSMIQPSGLPGLRQASTKPTTANGAETQTGTEPPAGVQALMRQAGQGHGDGRQGQHHAAQHQHGRR